MYVFLIEEQLLCNIVLVKSDIFLNLISNDVKKQMKILTSLILFYYAFPLEYMKSTESQRILQFFQNEKKMCQRRKWQHTQVFLPENSREQRGLVGSSPWGCEEPDSALQLNRKDTNEKMRQKALYIWVLDTVFTNENISDFFVLRFY